MTYDPLVWELLVDLLLYEALFKPILCERVKVIRNVVTYN